jgi:hypothetical protein
LIADGALGAAIEGAVPKLAVLICLSIAGGGFPLDINILILAGIL